MVSRASKQGSSAAPELRFGTFDNVVVVVVKLNPHGPIMSIGGVIYSIYIVSR